LTTFVLVCVIVVGIALLIASATPLVHNFKKHRSTRLLERLGRRFRGTLINNRKKGDYVLARIQGRPYRIELGDTEFPLLTISTPFPTSDVARPLVESKKEEQAGGFRMSITPSKNWRGITNAQDIPLGNPVFDDRYFVQANDEKILLGTVTSQCQTLIEKIFRQFYGRKFELRLVGDELQLDSGIRVDEPSKVFLIVRFFSELNQYLQQANEVADSIDVDTVEWTGETTCLICGESVTHQIVQCSKCKTEYHLDCWEYVGNCGRYACGAKRYLSDDNSDNPELFRIDT
jgi:hypothetical protein